MNAAFAFGRGCDQRTIACEIAAAVPVPARVLVVPWGNVESTKGDFPVDAESGRMIVEAIGRHGVDIPFDYEHQTMGGEFSSPTGAAPAAGWCKFLEVVPGEGVYAHVEWTRPAAEAIGLKQYRYLSPVVMVRKSDGKAVALHSIGLTNKPAIVGMRPIVNSAGGGSDDRSRMIRGAAHRWDCDRSVQKALCRDVYVDLVLREAGQVLLSNSERGRLPTASDLTGDRSGTISRAAEEWEANKDSPMMFTSKDAWVNDALRQAGHTLLNGEEQAGISTLALSAPAVGDANGPFSSDTPRNQAIRKLAKEWASMGSVSRTMWRLPGYVGYNLPEGEPELREDERAALAKMTVEDVANL